MSLFFKATACGNDYVYFDLRSKNLDETDKRGKMIKNLFDETGKGENNTKSCQDCEKFESCKKPCFNIDFCCKKEFSEFVKSISNRRFGVGADGVVVITDSDKADAKMIIFNADGSRAKICGNALRVVAAYLTKKSVEETSKAFNYFTVETDSGMRQTFSKKVENSDYAYYSSVCMGKVEQKKMPENVVNFLQNRLKNDLLFVVRSNCGNEHLVVGLKSKIFDYEVIGGLLQQKSFFSDGINVHFAVKNDDCIFVNHYERGSGITLSCGSGATAVANAYLIKGLFCENEKIKIKSDGGEVFVLAYNGDYYMSGQIRFVFSGEFLYCLNLTK